MTVKACRFTIDRIFAIFVVLLLLFSFTIQPVSEMWAGYLRIISCPSVLISDYIYVGGLGATLFNVATTTGLNLIFLKLMKAKINGSVFACLMTISGFAFFGKNLFNALPIYLGIFLYCLSTKTKVRDHVLVFLLSSGISPVTSFMIFGLGFPLWLGVAVGLSAGVLIGFILPAFNEVVMRFHKGYNLYNTGFSMGVLSMLITGILHSFDIAIYQENELSNAYHYQFFWFILASSILFIAVAFLKGGKNTIFEYKCLLTKSGRLRTDFALECGWNATSLNIGIMGLVSVLLVLFTPITINGPIMAAILTIIGFAAFGKHPLNTVPVIIGAILAIELTPHEWTIGTSLAVLFVTGLAPIAGQFGLLAGVAAGFIHLLITPLALEFQGGFDLYNNGFAAGFVAAVLSSFFNHFLKKRDDKGKWNFLLPLKSKQKAP